MFKNQPVDKETFGLPPSASYLGRDGDGYLHYYSATDRRVWVFKPIGSLYGEFDLGDVSIRSWIERIEIRNGGWSSLHPENCDSLEVSAEELRVALDRARVRVNRIYEETL